MQPRQRIHMCECLLAGRLPEAFAGDGCACSTAEGSAADPDVAGIAVKLLLKDAQELRAVMGLALIQSGCYVEAWQTWVQAAQLAAEDCPPFDESLYVYALQAALCAAASDADSEDLAQRHLLTSIELHSAAFGGDEGLELFHRRCAREVELIVGLTPGRQARVRQQQLLLSSQLDASQLARRTWSELQAEVLRWQVPKQAARQQAAKLGCKSRCKGRAKFMAKPKALVMDGLRVLP